MTHDMPEVPDIDLGENESLMRQLHLASVRTRTHIHHAGSGSCSDCLADIAFIGFHGFSLVCRIHELERQLRGDPVPKSS